MNERGNQAAWCLAHAAVAAGVSPAKCEATDTFATAEAVATALRAVPLVAT